MRLVKLLDSYYCVGEWSWILLEVFLSGKPGEGSSGNSSRKGGEAKEA